MSFGCKKQNDNFSDQSQVVGFSDVFLSSNGAQKFLDRWGNRKEHEILFMASEDFNFEDKEKLITEAGKPDHLPDTIKLYRSKLNPYSKAHEQDVVSETTVSLRIDSPNPLTRKAEIITFGKAIGNIKRFISLTTGQNMVVRLGAKSVNFWKWIDEKFVDSCVKNWGGPGAPES